jgi:hypothetical protein
MGGACVIYGREEKCVQGFVGKPEGNKWDGSYRSRIGWRGLDLSSLGYGQVEGFHEHSNEPSNSTKSREFLE